MPISSAFPWFTGEHMALFLNPSFHFSLYQNKVRTFRNNAKQTTRVISALITWYSVLIYSYLKLHLCLLKMLFKAWLKEKSPSLRMETIDRNLQCSCREALWARFGGGCDAAWVVKGMRPLESPWGSLVWWNKACFIVFWYSDKPHNYQISTSFTLFYWT